MIAKNIIFKQPYHITYFFDNTFYGETKIMINNHITLAFTKIITFVIASTIISIGSINLTAMITNEHQEYNPLTELAEVITAGNFEEFTELFNWFAGDTEGFDTAACKICFKLGTTPLHLAVQQHQDYIVRHILEYEIGYNYFLNFQDLHAKTPLHYAIETQTDETTALNNYRITSMLLEAGAKQELSDMYGSTAYAYIPAARKWFLAPLFAFPQTLLQNPSTLFENRES